MRVGIPAPSSPMVPGGPWPTSGWRSGATPAGARRRAPSSWPGARSDPPCWSALGERWCRPSRWIASSKTLLDFYLSNLLSVFSYACAISAGESVLITGGHSFVTLSTVTRYSVRGLEDRLPDLNSPRHSHACTSYVSGDNTQVRGIAICKKVNRK